VLPADRTVTFVALKPGLLFPPGSRLAGELELVDIGLDPDADGADGSRPRANLVQRDDVADWYPKRTADAHKWHAAVRVIAGSHTMTGAAALAADGALRAGAGMVQVSVPGVDPVRLPVEAVLRPLPATGWAEEALRTLERFHAVVIGPGLGRRDETAASARYLILSAPLPMVIDGDGLFALAWTAEGAAALLKRRMAATVVTPHDGEMRLLTGSAPGRDRIGAARALARDSGSVVLLKGPATVVADPGGEVLVVTTGDERLATAGTGDVLTGIIGALLAHRIPPLHAAAAGAWIHGRAARLGPSFGLVASDLPELIPQVLSQL
jgi:NAD(P)H-hydrate epimerase